MHFYKILAAFLLISSCLWSQAPVRHPKVGLALSGGAAHGFAHIGVLQYLDEMGIKVDYVTGTSMGSVIGGLYAMGYTADEIAEIAAGIDWSLLISNRSPLWEVAPVEKEAHEKIPVSVVWKDNAFRFPRGIMLGQKLDLIISKIYAPAYFIDDFDDFHIPFRCLAVDIVDGSLDVLDSGYLGEAIRASMAIPSVFPPKEIDGTLYVDGGLLRNYPAQEVIDLGAEFVIGVYVGGVMEERDKLQSAFDIFKQTTWMNSILDSKEQEKLVDINIVPDVKEIGSFEFERYQDFIDLGYAAAADHTDELREISVKLKERPQQQRNPKLNSLDYLRFSEISTSATESYYHQMIIDKLNFKVGENVSFNQLEESLSLVYGTKNFSKTSYDFEVGDEGIELIVNTEEVDPYSIGVSLNRFRYYNASIIVSGAIRNKFGRPSQLKVDLRLSENPGVQLDYSLRLPSSQYIMHIAAKYETFRMPLYNLNQIDRLYRADQGEIKAGLMKEWKNKFLFNANYRYQFDKLRPIVFKDNDIRRYKTYKHGLEIGLVYNDLDRPVFPESGVKVRLSSDIIIDNRLRRIEQSDSIRFLPFQEDKRYLNASFGIQYYKNLGKVCAELDARGRLSTGQSLLDNYKLGGPVQEKNDTYGFVGLNDSELIVGDHIFGKFGLRINLRKQLYITPTLQYIYGKDFLSFAFGHSDIVSELGYGLGFGIMTPIGPVTLDVGYTSLKNRAVANLGFGFRHIM